MGKFLLSLFCLLATVMPAIAETIEITPSDLGKTDSKYVTTAFDFTKDGITFTINNVNPSTGQVQANKAVASAFYIYNKTAIVNITKVEMQFTSVGAKTPDKAYFDIKGTPISSSINSSTITGKWDETKKAATWDCIDNSDQYFRINFNTNVNGTVKFSKIIITYENATEPIEPPFNIDPENIILRLGESASFPDISPASLIYTYSTESNDVIEIDSDNKSIKALAIGNAVVNFTTAPVEGKYLAGKGSFNVTVLGKEPKMEFANPSIYGKVNTGVVWQQVTVTEPTGDRGVITYSSSDPEVVSVDATTGQIRPADVKKAGVATITATMAANGDYAEGTAEYLIVVIDPNGVVEPGTTVFDFTTENPYGMTTLSGNIQKYETDMTDPVTSIAGINNTVILDFAGRYRAWKTTSDSYELRVETGNTDNAASVITVSVPDGYKITKIGITGSQVKPAFDPASSETASDPDFKSVWEPMIVDGAPQVINKVDITAASQQLRISKINVMWDAADSDLEPAQLTFTPNVNGIYVDEVAKINAVNNPNVRTVTYSIAGLSENDYTIEQIEDKLNVLVTKPGSYTLEARSAAGDGFRDGFAIMRLNVYRHLSVYADEVMLKKDEVDTNTAKFITIDVPENANLYYCLANESVPAADETADEPADENQLAGYTLYEDGITVPAKTTGSLNFYIANYGYLSPIRKISLGFETGIEEIGAETATGATRVFDLNGREIKGTPDKGIYIRIKDGKASKIVIK